MSSEADIQRLLGFDTVAVIGCSGTPGKAAHDVPAYLQRQGYEVVPVNPFRDRVLGRPAYDSLADVREAVELVNVFRPSEELPGVVDRVLERRAERGDVEGLWVQLGIRDDDAVTRARDAGVTAVQDRCIMVEHRQFWS